MITGQCFCGTIRYKVKNNILKSGICYCYDCRRLTGGTALPFIAILQESLIIEGETKEFTRPGTSGKSVRVSFCGTCGSTLFGRPEVWPHISMVAASSLNDQNLFSPDMYVWTEQAPKWTLFDPGIPKFDRGSIET